ncbi:MAG: D-glycerate dehydrogenase [Planctomycetes bacterium]|nr:D-glycerate dehydrogenase [Planctomycetota bacterium]
MPQIYVTYPIPGPGIELLRESAHDLIVNPVERFLSTDELHRAIAGCAGVLTQLRDKVDGAFFEAAGPGLKVVSNYAVGFNNIDVAEAERRGVTVCNTPGVLTDATADIAWALLMGIARRVSEGDRMVREGRWTGWNPHQLLGSDIAGRTLAIIGAGRIGYAMAKRSIGWDMPLLYVARHDKREFDRLGARRVELDQALSEADFVSIHVPLSEATHHLIDARRLALMKPTAYLINTARGPVVDEQALVKALQAGQIAGAGLDVYEREPELEQGLAACDNALLLPHLGSATHQTRAAMSDIAARNLLCVLHGDPPPHKVSITTSV